MFTRSSSAWAASAACSASASCAFCLYVVALRWCTAFSCRTHRHAKSLRQPQLMLMTMTKQGKVNAISPRRHAWAPSISWQRLPMVHHDTCMTQIEVHGSHLLLQHGRDACQPLCPLSARSLHAVQVCGVLARLRLQRAHLRIGGLHSATEQGTSKEAPCRLLLFLTPMCSPACTRLCQMSACASHLAVLPEDQAHLQLAACRLQLAAQPLLVLPQAADARPQLLLLRRMAPSMLHFSG